MIHLVVPCTASKRGNPIARLRDYKAPTVEERFHAWREALWLVGWEKEDKERRKRWRSARRIYQGPTWTQTKRIEAALKIKGEESRLYVASAGWGLIHADRPYCEVYEATFATGCEDSVGSASDCRKWWDLLGEMPPRWILGFANFRTMAAVEITERIMMVLSSSYYNAMQDDLKKGIEDRLDAADFEGVDPAPMLFITSQSATVCPDLEPYTVRTSQWMRKPLKTNNVCLNHRAAIYLVENLDLSRLDRQEAQDLLYRLDPKKQPSLEQMLLDGLAKL